MPNRIIKESICTSEEIDNLTWFEEVLFYRLLVNCDDYGRYDGRLKVIKSALFPLKDVTLDSIKGALVKISEVGLVEQYEVEGRPYLQLCSWGKHQRIRNSKGKYPEPTKMHKITTSPQIAASCGELRQNAAQYNPIQSNTIQSNPIQERVSVSANNINYEDIWEKTSALYPKTRSMAIAKNTWARKIADTADPLITARLLYGGLKMWKKQYLIENPDDDAYKFAPDFNNWLENDCDYWITHYGKAEKNDTG